MPLNCHYPEMGETRPADTQIEAQLAHYGRHYYLRTRLDLPAGRGVESLGAETINCGPRAGQTFNRYKVTIRAFERLCEVYRVSSEMLL